MYNHIPQVLGRCGRLRDCQRETRPLVNHHFELFARTDVPYISVRRHQHSSLCLYLSSLFVAHQTSSSKPYLINSSSDQSVR